MVEGRAAAIDGLRGIGVALETVATLALMCDPRDLGTTLGDTCLDPNGASGEEDPPPIPRRMRGGPAPGYSPTLFLYEHTPGGIGLSERIFVQRELLLARALRLVEGCPCVSGCPACVGPGDLSGVAPLGAGAPPARRKPTGRKARALSLLRRAASNVRALGC
jgi:DEAD/DEAH box helicase domain-containing protein